MRFTKYTGLGNDFVFLDGTTAEAVKNPAALARRVCDRRLGIGADGLVLLLPSKTADVKMRIFNADGSEAEMCGNASRCVPIHLRHTGKNTSKHITLETLAGPIQTEIIDEQKNWVRVNMGTPRLLNEALTVHVNGTNFCGTSLSMGNPHFVIFVQDISQIDLAAWGPKIETHNAFPHKTNVEFVQVLSNNSVRMRVWERGAGITQACGTGACATVAACVLHQKTGPNVRVILDGGELEIAWPDRQAIWMSGPAKAVFTGDFIE